MRNLNRILSVVFIATVFLLFSACKKVSHEISDEIVSINESTVASIQVGKKLNVGFITNNVSTFEFSIVKDGTVLLQENVTLTDGKKITTQQFDIPLDQTWVGPALLMVKYGANIQKSKPIIFEESNPEMYIVGGSVGAGWEPTLATPLALYDEDSKAKFETFEYITVAGDGFKFLPTNIDWTNAYGKGAAVGTLEQDEDAGNITVTQDGFYRVRMDAEGLTYELLPLTMGVIGDATPGEWDNDTDMTFIGGKGSYTWQVTLNLVPGKIKFRANDDWAINFGGTADDITPGGADIVITTAGTYNLELDLTPGAYKAVIQKQ
ncbi:SusF/SusE family outer membrane protein [Sphingobacterium rhinopitheci]|uniref:SusF/SusE family outer membrane protein n=1 Tax=Sphingobacterium rhinopitheci TaxID=2781960 RepID=UPI001F5199CF|nr:SusF/SusE family outer membrane protein [Sphingobacterium rhinopitheci]MCI0920691.1 SusF/SusE family outer membrane protein [Sphingobacterium rhinopitheci]